jgi:Fe-S-cluster-containing dehydrogenase component
MSADAKQTPQTMDPYKAANLDEVPLDEKVKDLITFVEKCKFCMMTTHDASSGILVSRCMALAGKACTTLPFAPSD